MPDATTNKLGDADVPQLFDGDARLFLKHAPHARCYGEYGVGLSTLWMAENTEAEIIGVDSSKAWIGKVENDLLPGRARFIFVDIGELGKWGRPLTYRRRDHFLSYAEGLWTGPRKPDLVLIDGRFRVCCFLISLANAAPGTKIVFDDYRDRPHYHLVEEYLKPAAGIDRQVLFIVPETVNRAELLDQAARFSMVVD